MDISKLEQLVARYKPEDKTNKVALNTFLKDGIQKPAQAPLKQKEDPTQQQSFEFGIDDDNDA